MLNIFRIVLLMCLGLYVHSTRIINGNNTFNELNTKDGSDSGLNQYKTVELLDRAYGKSNINGKSSDSESFVEESHNEDEVADSEQINMEIYHSPRLLSTSRKNVRLKTLIRKKRQAPKKQPKVQKITSILSKILDVYNVDSLDEVSIEGKHIFKDLVAGQKNFLKTRLQNLERSNYDVEDVIKTVERVFNRMNIPNDVTFKNFLNVLEFTATYIGENVEHLTDLYNDNPQNLANIIDVNTVQKLTVQQRLKEFAKKISVALTTNVHNQIPGKVSVDSLATEITSIKNQIAGVAKNGNDPDFRDPYSAAYHYYKHRNFRAQNRVLSVAEYYAAMRADLDEVKKGADYQKLLGHVINEINSERYHTAFGKNTKLVLKLQNGKINIASFYIIE